MMTVLSKKPCAHGRGALAARRSNALTNGWPRNRVVERSHEWVAWVCGRTVERSIGWAVGWSAVGSDASQASRPLAIGIRLHGMSWQRWML